LFSLASPSLSQPLINLSVFQRHAELSEQSARYW